MSATIDGNKLTLEGDMVLYHKHAECRVTIDELIVDAMLALWMRRQGALPDEDIVTAPGTYRLTIERIDEQAAKEEHP